MMHRCLYFLVLLHLAMAIDIENNVTNTSIIATDRNFDDRNVCDHFCWNGQYCSHKRCQGCIFACPQQTCRQRLTTCKTWCDTGDCEIASCQKCRWCNLQKNATLSSNTIVSRNLTSTIIDSISTELTVDNNATINNNTFRTVFQATPKNCTVTTFQDRTEVLFSTSKTYWDQWNHSGRPYFHEGAPVFIDIDNDGVLDYFNSMHGHKSNTFKNRMELGIGVSVNGTKDEFSFSMESQRIILNDKNEERIDMHGEIIADLDGDGVLDIYIANGGGELLVNDDETITEQFDNWLFWGDEQTNHTTNKTEIIFTGGRDTAREAGIEMKLGRGRFNYLLDINGDGLLDIFSSQDRRVRNIISPGVLLINQGNRTWKKDDSLREYTRTMMITDADGDGFAREFLLNRGFCYPQRNGPYVDEKFPEFGPYSKENKLFCNSRPVGTTAIYAFNKTSKMVEEVSQPYRNFWAAAKRQRPCCQHGSYNGGNDCNAQSMASGDFDGDQIIDHVQLYATKIVFFFSSDRKIGEFPDNSINVGLEIKLPDYCSKGLTLRVVDFNNDGKEEILVGCINAGTFLLYTRGDSKYSWTLDNDCNNGETSLGDLGLINLAKPSHDDMLNFCSEIDSEKWGMADKVCRSYLKKDGKTNNVAKLAGVAVVDINNDGFPDIITTHHFGYLRFFYNIPSQESKFNQFIAFKLTGAFRAKRPNNVYGIGATLILTCTSITSGEKVKQMREISSFQHSNDKFGSKEDRLIFGLGTHLVPNRIQVLWPNGLIQNLSLKNWEFSQSSAEVIEIVDRGSKLIHISM